MPISVQASHTSQLPAAQNLSGAGAGRAQPQDRQSDPEKLRTEQQSLQNQILLLKNGSDSAALSEDSIEVLEKRLEKISAARQAAQGQSSPAADLRKRFDTYEPSGPQQSPGLYAVSPDDAGGYALSFSPYSEGEPVPDAASPEKQSKSETGTMNTDQVDAEIRSLKSDKQALEEQIAGAESRGDEQKLEQLERRLTQLDAELRQKDNDAYRKQHAAYFEG